MQGEIFGFSIEGISYLYLVISVILTIIVMGGFKEYSKLDKNIKEHGVAIFIFSILFSPIVFICVFIYNVHKSLFNLVFGK